MQKIIKQLNEQKKPTKFSEIQIPYTTSHPRMLPLVFRGVPRVRAGGPCRPRGININRKGDLTSTGILDVIRTESGEAKPSSPSGLNHFYKTFFGDQMSNNSAQTPLGAQTTTAIKTEGEIRECQKKK